MHVQQLGQLVISGVIYIKKGDFKIIGGFLFFLYHAGGISETLRKLVLKECHAHNDLQGEKRFKNILLKQE